MNICFLLPPTERYSPISGGSIAIKTMQMAQRLISRGHDVTVLAPAGEDATYSVGRVVPIQSPSPESLPALPKAISRWRRKLMRWDWLYYEYYLRSARRALRRMEKRPGAVLIFNDLVTPRWVKRWLPTAKVVCMLSSECVTRQKGIRKTISAVHKFAAVSGYIRDWTIQRYAIPADKIVTIPSGADLETFRPRPSYLSSASPIKVLFLGRIDPAKGPDLAADAVEKLRAEGVPITLTVAGGRWLYDQENGTEDAYFTDLRQKMAAAAAEYLGHVPRPDVPGLVRRHDIACVLSRGNDPMPLTLFEAMASGLAVLASERGGIPEACDGAAWMVNVDEFGAIVGALRSLATIGPVLNEYKRRSIARAARATWDMSVDALERMLLEDAIPSDSPRGP
jgi:glycosyltransferase involved in cell wall biosynthesis